MIRVIIIIISTQAVKKGSALWKTANMKKAVKYRWWPRNGCDSRSMKNDNSGEFVLPYPSFTMN